MKSASLPSSGRSNAIFQINILRARDGQASSAAGATCRTEARPPTENKRESVPNVR
jgi:hypothetical protein